MRVDEKEAFKNKFLDDLYGVFRKYHENFIENLITKLDGGFYKCRYLDYIIIPGGTNGLSVGKQIVSFGKYQDEFNSHNEIVKEMMEEERVLTFYINRAILAAPTFTFLPDWMPSAEKYFDRKSKYFNRDMSKLEKFLEENKQYEDMIKHRRVTNLIYEY